VAEKNYKTPKKLPKYQSKEVIFSILDKAKKDSYRNYIMLMTLWRTGIRLSELSKIRKSDIKDGNLIVRNGKGGKDRTVPLEGELENLLGLYSDNMKPNEELFDIKERQIRNIVYKYSNYHTGTRLNKKTGKEENINIYEVHPHTFRHSFAVHCLKNGINLRSLQKILGHSSLTTTQVYLDVLGKDVKDDFDKVEW